MVGVPLDRGRWDGVMIVSDGLWEPLRAVCSASGWMISVPWYPPGPLPRIPDTQTMLCKQRCKRSLFLFISERLMSRRLSFTCQIMHQLTTQVMANTYWLQMSSQGTWGLAPGKGHAANSKRPPLKP